MAIPVYIWLNDDDGSSVKGSTDTQNRVGSIEIVAYTNSTLMVVISLMRNTQAGRDL